MAALDYRGELRVRSRAGLLPEVSGVEINEIRKSEALVLLARVENAWQALGEDGQKLAREAKSEIEFTRLMASRSARRLPVVKPPKHVETHVETDHETPARPADVAGNPSVVEGVIMTLQFPRAKVTVEGDVTTDQLAGVMAVFRKKD